MKRFEIWMAELPAEAGSHVQQGVRPVVVVSNDAANRYSPVVTVVPLTSQRKKPLPTHVVIRDHGLKKISTALCEQVTSVDRARLTRPIGFVYNALERTALCHALSVQLGMAA